jgi:hypothetical protein
MFPKMTEVLAPCQQGAAVIDHIEVTKRASMMSAFRRGMYCPEGVYARLRVDGCLMMTDTHMERRSNYQVLRESHGRVLIGGLGLGMILHPILAKPEVKSVTVLEKYQDVIDLVGPTLPQDKLQIICADVFTWAVPKGQTWNVIYWDIWPNICADNLKEVSTLHRRFARRLDRSDSACWMGSWQHRELKRLRRER